MSKKVVGTNPLQTGKTVTNRKLVSGTTGDDQIFLDRAVYDGGYSVGGSFYTGLTPFDAGAGKDTVYGRQASEAIRGGNGSDILNGGGGNDTLDGGSADGGVDWISFAANPWNTRNPYFDGVTVSIATRDLSFSYDTLAGLYTGVALGFENVWGSTGADQITGDGRGNELRGEAGNDVIRGMEGPDFLYGGTGNDLIAAGKWFYSYRSVNGVMTLVRDPVAAADMRGTGNDNNTIDAGDGDDTVISAIGNDWIDGGAGGFDVADYSYLPENFLMRYSLQGAQWTKLTVYTLVNGVEEIYEQDWLRNIEGVIGGRGNDGSVGDPSKPNQLDGGDGNDSVTGGRLPDSLDGGDGQDTVNGGDGDDTIDGGRGNDDIDGGTGNDRLLAGGGGNDTVDGGDGDRDLVSFAPVPGETYDPCSGLPVDTKALVIDLRRQDYSFKQSPEAALWYGSVLNVEDVTGAKCSDQIAGDDKDNILDGGAGGDDILYGAGGNDIFRGGKGSDWVAFQAATDGNTPRSRYDAGLLLGGASVTPVASIAPKPEGTAPAPKSPGGTREAPKAKDATATGVTVSKDTAPATETSTVKAKGAASPAPALAPAPAPSVAGQVQAAAYLGYDSGMTVKLGEKGGFYSYTVADGDGSKTIKEEASGLENVLGSIGDDWIVGDSAASVTFSGVLPSLVGKRISFVYNGEVYTTRTLTEADVADVRAARLPDGGLDLADLVDAPGLSAGDVLANIVNDVDLRLIAGASISGTGASGQANLLVGGVIQLGAVQAMAETASGKNLLGFLGVVPLLSAGDVVRFRLAGNDFEVTLPAPGAAVPTTADWVAAIQGAVNAALSSSGHSVTVSAFNLVNLRLESTSSLANGVFENNLISSDIEAGLDNILAGDAGFDTLEGGLGNDTILGGEGAFISGDSDVPGNWIKGGAGADTFIVGYRYDPVLASLDGSAPISNTSLDALPLSLRKGLIDIEAADDATDFIQDWQNIDGLYVGAKGVAVIKGQLGDTTNWGAADLVDLQRSDVRNQGLIAVSTGAGDDTIKASNGDDWIHPGTGLNLVDLGTGGSDGADRVYIDQWNGQYEIRGFDTADKVYIDQSMLEGFLGAALGTRYIPQADAAPFLKDTVGSATISAGRAYNEDFVFPLSRVLWDAAYRDMLNEYQSIELTDPSIGPANGWYSNGAWPNTVHLAAEVQGTTAIGLAAYGFYGLGANMLLVPFVGPLLAIPFFVIAGLMAYDAIQNSTGHLNGTYSFTEGNGDIDTLLTFMKPQEGLSTSETAWNEVALLDFYNLPSDRFTRTLEVSSHPLDKGIGSIVTVYSDNETFVYLVYSKDSLIQDNETRLIAQINGRVTADQFVMYRPGDESDPYFASGSTTAPVFPPGVSTVSFLEAGDKILADGRTNDPAPSLQFTLDKPLGTASVALSVNGGPPQPVEVSFAAGVYTCDLPATGVAEGEEAYFSYVLTITSESGLTSVSDAYLLAIDLKAPQVEGFSARESGGGGLVLQFSTNEDASVELTGDVERSAQAVESGTNVEITLSGAEGSPGLVRYSQLVLTDALGNADSVADLTLGSSTGDTITGTNSVDLVFGFGGDDSLSGVQGNDSLAGGAGNDTLDGGQDDDFLDAGAGDDSLAGGLGQDTLAGGAGNDQLTGGAGNDTVNYADATSGLSIALDSIGGGSVTDATGGTDTLLGIENVTGGSGSDTIESTATDAANRFDGADGSDTLAGGGGNDTLIGGAGNDSLDGEGGTDTVDYSYLIREVEIDSVTGAIGADLTRNLTVLLDALGRATVSVASGDSDSLVSVENIVGGAGNDSIASADGANIDNHFDGGGGDDTLSGGGGNDTLVGHTGNDSLAGGSGFDAVDYSYTQNDLTIDLDDQGAAVVTVASATDTDSLEGIEHIIGGAGDDEITGASAIGEGYRFDGGAGDDTLTGDEGDDTLAGGEGSDSLDGGAGGDVFVWARKEEGGDTLDGFTSGQDQLMFLEEGFGTFDPQATDWFAAESASGFTWTEGTRFHYDTDSGQLWFDADGNGASSAAVLIVTLTGAANLVQADLAVTAPSTPPI